MPKDLHWQIENNRNIKMMYFVDFVDFDNMNMLIHTYAYIMDYNVQAMRIVLLFVRPKA